MRKANISIIAVLLIACFFVAVAPVSAKTVTSESCITIPPKEARAYYFSPGVKGDWTCKLSINYPMVIGAKAQKVSFAWRQGSGTLHTWYSTTMSAGKTIKVPFHSGSSDINYVVTVSNPSSIVTSVACINIY